MISGQTGFLQILGWAVLNSLWQMALLWLIYQVIVSVFPSLRSSQKSTLSFIFLLTGFSWFIFTFTSTYFNSTVAGTVVDSGLIPGGDEGTGQPVQRLLPFISILYILLLIVPVSRFIRNYRYVRIIRKYGLSKMDVQWRVFVQKIAAQMGIKRPVHIWVSEFINSPVTIGFLKPVILVPLAAINHLSTQQMESILLHELAHIRRHDYLINLVINCIRTILYFNPFVKAFVRNIEKEREKSCDETVLQFQYDSYEYASALLTLEKTNHNSSPVFILAAAGNQPDLLHRIEMIMGVRKKKISPYKKIAGTMAALFCIFALNILMVAGKHKKIDSVASASPAGSSLAFFASQNENTGDSRLMEARPSMVTNNINRSGKEEQASTAIDAAQRMVSPGYTHVRFIEPLEVPRLDKYQEEQVRTAMEASKKVLENAEWKTLEKNIADVFTEKEKEELKNAYRKELSKFDWDSWENKLRIAYNNVNWNKVNDQLSLAVNNIRLDSLRKVYNEALCKLDQTAELLSASEIKGIPDSDITLKAIEDKKVEMNRALNRIRATRAKKIVHL